MSEPEIGSYRDADGARHHLVVRQTADGDWHVLDVNTSGETARVVEALAGDQDGGPQAEAIARDYLTTVVRSRRPAGRTPAEAISEQGGPDARSHHRPTSEGSPAHHGGGAAVSGPAR